MNINSIHLRALACAICRASIISFVLASFSNGHCVRAGELVIWDNQPAGKWDTAYPVGNGRLGAMPLGHVPGGEDPDQRGNDLGQAATGSACPRTATSTWKKSGSWKPPEITAGPIGTSRSILKTGRIPAVTSSLGWLHLDYQDTAPLKQIHRELDLKTGIAKNVYALDDGTEITQKVFASGPDDVIAVRSRPTGKSASRCPWTGASIENGDIVKTGAASGENATRFVGRVRAFPADKTDAGRRRAGDQGQQGDHDLPVRGNQLRPDATARRCCRTVGRPKRLRDLDRLQGQISGRR